MSRAAVDGTKQHNRLGHGLMVDAAGAADEWGSISDKNEELLSKQTTDLRNLQ